MRGRFYRLTAALMISVMIFTSITIEGSAASASLSSGSTSNADATAGDTGSSEDGSSANTASTDTAATTTTASADNAATTTTASADDAAKAVSDNISVSEDAAAEADMAAGADISLSISDNTISDDLFFPCGAADVQVTYVSDDLINECRNRTAEDKRFKLFTYRVFSPQYESSYDIYSTQYFYNRMSDAEKEDYMALKAECDKFMRCEENATVMNVNGHKSCITGFIDLEGLPEGASDAENKQYTKRMINLFMMSNPQYFFMFTSYLSTTSGTSVAFVVPECCVDKNARRELRDSLFNTVEEVLDSFDDSFDPENPEQVLDRIGELQAWLADNIEYNQLSDESGNLSDDAFFQQTIYSTFIEKETVCAGYARAMQLMCNYYGIDCIEVVSAKHAWNMVRYKDNWYNIDPTWADQRGLIYYQYYMRTTDWYLNQDANMDNRIMHIPVEETRADLPETPYGAEGSYGTSKPANIPAAERKVDVNISYTEIGPDVYRVTFDSSLQGVSFFIDTEGNAPDDASTRCSRIADGCCELDGTALSKARVIGVKAGYLNSDITDICQEIEFTGQYAMIDDEILLVTNYVIPVNYLTNAEKLPYLEYTDDTGVSILQYNIGNPYDKNNESIYSVDPCKMNVPVTTRIYYYDESSEEYIVGCEETICFADYCKALLANKDIDARTKEYVRALLLLGGECQKYFDVNEDNLVSSGISMDRELSMQEFLKALGNESFAKTVVTYESKDGTFEFGGVYLTLDSGMSLNILLEVDSSEMPVSLRIGNAEITLKDEAGKSGYYTRGNLFVGPAVTGNEGRDVYNIKYYINYNDIFSGSHALENIEVYVGGEKKGAISTSVMSYLYVAANSSNERFIPVHDICRYLYIMSDCVRG